MQYGYNVWQSVLATQAFRNRIPIIVTYIIVY